MIERPAMRIFNNNFLLRFPVAIILFAHGIPPLFNNGINDFGNFYLNEVGFSPLGVPIAWAIKLSHIFCGICLLWNKFIKLVCVLVIFILVMGIVMVHFKEGWYVVGGGTNGMEYNFLLIFVCLAIMFPDGTLKRDSVSTRKIN